MKGYRIQRYSQADREAWDNFVRQAKNATFLFLRSYMEYHADRFEDASLLIYDGRSLLALLPGNLAGTTYYSHQGLTYGGLLTTIDTTYLQTGEALATALCYIRQELGADRFVCRLLPYIYHRYPSDELLYALTRAGALLTARSLSSVVPLAEVGTFRRLRRRQQQKAGKCGLQVVEDEHFECFWPILEDNLSRRYNASPVHSLAEMTQLHRCFPREISLFRVCRGEETVGGCVVYETSRVAHVQYIAATEEGKNMGALDYLFAQLIRTRYAHKTYFDFGISTEQGGKWLNEGLLFQKEGFAARGVVYDVYELSLKSVEIEPA